MDRLKEQAVLIPVNREMKERDMVSFAIE